MGKFASRSEGFTVAVLVTLVILQLSLIGPPASAEEASRFRIVGQLTNGPVDWVSVEGGRVAFGSGPRLRLGDAEPNVVLKNDRLLDRHVGGAVLMGDELYFVDGSMLMALDPGSSTAHAAEVPLEPIPSGRLSLARMADYLLVAEDGFGVRWLRFSRSHKHGPGAAHAHERPTLRQIGALELSASFTAVAAADPLIYLATSDRRLLVLDAAGRQPMRVLPLDFDVRSLAANGKRLFALTPEGLRLMELDDAGAVSTELHAEVRGYGIQVAGRTLYIAGGDSGMQTMRDGAARAAIHSVTVGDNFFSPSNLSIDRGDTVQWTNPGSISIHNVRSCSALESGCGGQTANESFFSGAPSSAFFFAHTFNLVGSNPYVCQVHTIFMTGLVTVTNPVAAPPGVPDGSGATTPLTVDKLVADGSNLSLGFDTATCAPTDQQVIFGTSAQLPAAIGGIYGVNGSVCNIGAASPFVWNGTPVVASGSFLWFLVLAENGIDEGSWGKATGSVERNGPGAGGSSGQCGLGGKNLSNVCGQ